MKIETKFFGAREINEEDILTFNRGIPGFEERRRYIIMPYSDKSPFFVMQSVDQSNLAFILIGLEEVIPGYSFDISDDLASQIKLTAPEDAVVFAIVTIPGDLAKSTVNLAAPVIINMKGKLGEQVIFNNSQYSLRHPLFTSQPSSADSECATTTG